MNYIPGHGQRLEEHTTNPPSFRSTHPPAFRHNSPMNDHRQHEVYEWVSTRLDGQAIAAFDPVTSDAGMRRYYRVRTESATMVAMDAPPATEDVRPFLDVAGRLQAAGVHVPQILAADSDHGLVLLEDLGTTAYLDALNEQDADALYGNAMEALITIQRRADTTGLPAYDPALLLSELALFPDWYLKHHWQVEPTDKELDAWDMLCMTLIRWAMDQPRVFVHRDYMPRNLIVSEPEPGIIDFQDAVVGPLSYDPVCLFRDAFISWPSERVDGWLESYRQRSAAAGLPVPASAELWRRTCDLMGVQRHLKVMGIFARLRYRDRKPKYVEDAPRFHAYLSRAIARNPELAELGTLLAVWEARREH